MTRILTLLLAVLVSSCNSPIDIKDSTIEEESWIVNHRSNDGMFIVDSISENRIIKIYIDSTKSISHKYHLTSDSILYRYSFFKDDTMQFYMDNLNRENKLIWGKNVRLHAKSQKGDKTILEILVSRPSTMMGCSYIYATTTDQEGKLDTIADKHSSEYDLLLFSLKHEKIKQFNLYSYICGTYAGQISIEL